MVMVTDQREEGVVDEEGVVPLIEVTLTAWQDLQARVKGGLTEHLGYGHRMGQRQDRLGGKGKG